MFKVDKNWKSAVLGEIAGLVHSCEFGERRAEQISDVIGAMLKREVRPLAMTAELTRTIIEQLGPPGKSCVELDAMNAVLRVGVRLIDDLADGDLPPALANRSELPVLTVFFFASLLQSASFNLGLAPERERALSRDIISCGNRLASGQMLDNGMRKIELIDLALIEKIITEKTGYYYEAFLRFAAHHAELEAPMIEHIGHAGRHLGVCVQLVNDVIDLKQEEGSRDLYNGIATLPVQLYLRELDSAQRSQWIAAREAERYQTSSGQATTSGTTPTQSVADILAHGSVAAKLRRIFNVHAQACIAQLGRHAKLAVLKKPMQTFIDQYSGGWALWHHTEQAARSPAHSP